MKLIISSVNRKYFEGEVKSATCPGTDGEFTLLSHHMPFITTLKGGEIKIKKEDSSEESFPISGGLLEVSENEAVVLL